MALGEREGGRAGTFSKHSSPLDSAHPSPRVCEFHPSGSTLNLPPPGNNTIWVEVAFAYGYSEMPVAHINLREKWLTSSIALNLERWSPLFLSAMLSRPDKAPTAESYHSFGTFI